MNTQVWLRSDQVELVIACLQHVRRKLNEDTASGVFANVAGPFTYRRIGEILELLEAKKKKGE